MNSTAEKEASRSTALGGNSETPEKRETRGKTGERNSPWVFSGLAGSIFATLCCIGIAPLVTLVMAVGLGFIIALTILLPLLLFFLAVGAYGLWRSHRRHGRPFPLILHTTSGLAILVLLFSRLHGTLVWVGLAGILGAAIWNIRLEHTYWHREPEVEFPRST